MKIVLSDPVFGKNLGYLRKKYSLSRKALGKLMGVSEYKIRHLEEPNWPLMGITMESRAFFRIGEVFATDANHLLSNDLEQSEV